MKAAILYELGSTPKYGEFPIPVAKNENQILITVKAAAIKQLDKAKASGKHYTTYASLPTTVGIDGAGILENGKRVYASGITGMIAEKALIPKNNWTELPDNLDFATAAAIPNALMGSDMALLYRAKIKKGNVVVINGATGITGKIATQLAKYRGASQVIVTGRNSQSLDELKELSADKTISLQNSDENIIEKLALLHQETPFDIVLDYIWGHPAELLFSILKNGKPNPVKYISIGQMAGTSINLESGILRSKPIEILGSGIGSLNKEEITHYMSSVLPEIFEWAATGNLKIDIENVELKNIENIWNNNSTKRIVIKI